MGLILRAVGKFALDLSLKLQTFLLLAALVRMGGRPKLNHGLEPLVSLVRKRIFRIAPSGRCKTN
jgi:hypothetical protein